MEAPGDEGWWREGRPQSFNLPPGRAWDRVDGRRRRPFGRHRLSGGPGRVGRPAQRRATTCPFLLPRKRRRLTTDRPVVLIAEELSPATVEALGPDFEIRSCNGADRAELLPAIADVDAILVRSATKVDAEALAAARRLKVVARAGVGLDNVDVKAATQAGVMVVNAPTSNIVSAAELAVGPDARRRPARLAGARRAEERRVEAVEVHRHRALREDRRHRRPGPDRRAGRAAAERLRHERDRLRPLRAGRPRRADGRPPRRPRHPARRGRLHVGAPAEDPRDRSA